MSLIDANETKAALSGWDTGPTDEEIERTIDKIPTVDAVEVVRCKDCKFWTDEIPGCTDHVKLCKIGFYMVSENGYCVFGERKDNE